MKNIDGVVDITLNDDLESIEINKHNGKFSIHLYDKYEALCVTNIGEDKILELIKKLKDLTNR